MLVNRRVKCYNSVGDFMKYSADDLKKIRVYERKNGITYESTGGILYNRLLIIGFLAWLFMMVMLLFYTLGAGILLHDKVWKYKEMLPSGKFSIIAVFIGFGILLLTPVLYAFKFRLTAFLLNAATIPVLFGVFVKLSLVKDSITAATSQITEYDPGFLGLKKLFFWRHGVPMLIVFVCVTWITVIAVRERVKLRSAYRHIQNDEYTPQIVKEDE